MGEPVTKFTGNYETIIFPRTTKEEDNLNLADFKGGAASRLLAPLDTCVRHLHFQQKESGIDLSDTIIGLGELYAACYNHPTATLHING